VGADRLGRRARSAASAAYQPIFEAFRALHAETRDTPMPSPAQPNFDPSRASYAPGAYKRRSLGT